MINFGRLPTILGRAMLLASATALSVPLAAQSTAPANTTTTNDSIGPQELRGFSLGENKAQAVPPVQPDLVPSSRRPMTQPAPSIQPGRTTPRPGPALARPSATTSRPVEPDPVDSPSPATVAQRAPSPAPRPAGEPASSVTVALPPADPLASRPTPANETDLPRMSSQPMGSAVVPEAELPSDEGSPLPWIFILLAIGGGVLMYAFRHRLRSTPAPEPAMATGPIPLPRELAPRSFPPVPPPPVPTGPPPGTINVRRPDAFAPPTPRPPARPAALGGGIVSTRLRPTLDIEFEPIRAVIDEGQASVLFDVVVTNSGSAPARQVLVEACMVNAGPEQDSELRTFFDRPIGVGDRIDAIPPHGRVSLKSNVSLPLDQIRAYEIGGRRLFVPLVAFNALFEWGSGTGQSSAAFILGRSTNASDGDGDGDGRMAPLRLDLGPRIFGGLEGRRHPLGMRR